MESSSVRQRSEVLSDSPPMFKRRWMDALTRVHPAVPTVLFAPAIAILFVIAVGNVGFGKTVGLVAVGYVAWTLAEYWIHRLIFHFEPEHGFGARLHWM